MLLTNMELATLGLLAEGEKHGYQIEQLIEQRGMREWTEIGFSSIYYTLNKMEAEKWLESEKQDSNQRPARKVYRLSRLGWQVYHDGVRDYLSAPRPRSGDFDLALGNILVLTQDEKREALSHYRDELVLRIKNVRRKFTEELEERLAPHIKALFEHSLVKLEAELGWVEKFMVAMDDEQQDQD
jgi:PadR family transcriptional regulator, regulatory protein PadR